MSKIPQRAFGATYSKVAIALSVSLTISAGIIFLTTSLILQQFGAVWPAGRLGAVSSLFFGSGFMFLVFAYKSAKEKLIGYAGAIATTLVFILITFSDLIRILSTPSDPNYYRTMAFLFVSGVNIALGSYSIVIMKFRKADLI